MLFNLVQTLPVELIELIWNNLNPHNKIFLNKKYYIELNYLIDGLVINYESYIRDIVRHDCSFSFNHILSRHFIHWLHKQNYKYNNIIYPDYINFILNYCASNNSSKCSYLINLQLNLSGLKKEWCKNSRIKYNRWSN